MRKRSHYLAAGGRDRQLIEIVRLHQLKSSFNLGADHDSGHVLVIGNKLTHAEEARRLQQSERYIDLTGQLGH